MAKVDGDPTNLAIESLKKTKQEVEREHRREMAMLSACIDNLDDLSTNGMTEGLSDRCHQRIKKALATQ